MGCGACKAKAQRLLRNSLKANQQSATPQPLVRCPACRALHTEEEYAKCPFRIQLDKQQAREARIKSLQPQIVKVETPAPSINRRGVSPATPPQNAQKTDSDSTSKKKW